MRIKSFLLLLVLAVLFPISAPSKDITFNNAPAQVYFSPHGGCTEAIVEALSKAKTEVLVQAYSFTSKEIAKALLDAHKRGVKTQIILDRSNMSGKYSAGDFTAHGGIPTYIDSDHAIAHNKVMIIDKETVITGSFNFTGNAEKSNAENLLIIKSRDLAKAYIENWQEHKGHSETYGGK